MHMHLRQASPAKPSLVSCRPLHGLWCLTVRRAAGATLLCIPVVDHTSDSAHCKATLHLRSAGTSHAKILLVACRMIMAALQDPLNQFFIQLSGGMQHRACLSACQGTTRPAALLGVCILGGSAAWGLRTDGQGSRAAGLGLTAPVNCTADAVLCGRCLHGLTPRHIPCRQLRDSDAASPQRSISPALNALASCLPVTLHHLFEASA